MCDFEHGLPPLDDDEFVLETPPVVEFVAGARARIAEAALPVHLVSSNPPDQLHRHDRLGGLIHEYLRAA
jgi:hypothetical protein